MKKTFTLLFVILLIILTSCKIGEWFNKKEEKKVLPNKTYNIKIPVTTSPAVVGTLIKYLYTNGEANGIHKTNIIAETAGNVDSIYLSENQLASKGDVVLQLDTERIQLDVEQARLNLEKAEAEYNAWRTIGEESDDNLLKVQTGLKEAEIQLRKLELDLDKTTVKMPFKGIISKLNVSSGEQVFNGDELFSIVDLDEIIIRAQVLESEISRIKNNSEAIIRFSAIKEKLYNGKIESISPNINNETRTCEILVKLNNDGNIKDGMFAEVKVAAEHYKNRIIVYKDALLIRDGKKLVFAVEDGKAKWQYVQTGVENNRFIEITEGVEQSQSIVIDGNFSLSHDASVDIEKTIIYEEIIDRF